jgi:hypothetical protein
MALFTENPATPDQLLQISIAGARGIDNVLSDYGLQSPQAEKILANHEEFTKLIKSSTEVALMHLLTHNDSVVTHGPK